MGRARATCSRRSALGAQRGKDPLRATKSHEGGIAKHAWEPALVQHWDSLQNRVNCPKVLVCSTTHVILCGSWNKLSGEAQCDCTAEQGSEQAHQEQSPSYAALHQQSNDLHGAVLTLPPSSLKLPL